MTERCSQIGGNHPAARESFKKMTGGGGLEKKVKICCWERVEGG